MGNSCNKSCLIKHNVRYCLNALGNYIPSNNDVVTKDVSKGVSEVSGNWSDFFNLKILV